jgi:hypothetical protein
VGGTAFGTALGCHPSKCGPRLPAAEIEAGSRKPAQWFAALRARARVRTTPERSKVHPFAFARLRMAVLAPDPGRAISQTAFEAWGRP